MGFLSIRIRCNTRPGPEVWRKLWDRWFCPAGILGVAADQWFVSGGVLESLVARYPAAITKSGTYLGQVTIDTRSPRVTQSYLQNVLRLLGDRNASAHLSPMERVCGNGEITCLDGPALAKDSSESLAEWFAKQDDPEVVVIGALSDIVPPLRAVRFRLAQWWTPFLTIRIKRAWGSTKWEGILFSESTIWLGECNGKVAGRSLGHLVGFQHNIREVLCGREALLDLDGQIFRQEGAHLAEMLEATLADF